MIPAKILLFGEHIIITGAQALVMPFPHFSGKWMYRKDAPEKQLDLALFADYLAHEQFEVRFNTKQFREDLSKGLFFESNIPTGYGLGSSGAVTAAVYDRYCIDKQQAHKKSELQQLSFLKKLFSQMESFFHGQSSGIDPLICAIQKPIWLETQQKIQVVTCQPLKNTTLFLLDTEISRSTSPFVKCFLKDWENREYADYLRQNLFLSSNNAIKEFYTGNGKKLFHSIHSISEIQLKYFSKMIPADFRSIWKKGLESDVYKLKLCGAGGGGFILGITHDFEKTKNVLANYKLIKI